MSNTIHTPFPVHSHPAQPNTRSVQRPRSGLRPDKPLSPPARTASPQPASLTTTPRAHKTESKSTRSQKQSTAKQKAVKVTVWVNPVVKAELQRIAEQERISISATGAAFLEKGIQEHVDLQYSALLEPIIKQAIRKGIRAYSNRLAFLLVRVAYASEQTRSLVTNIFHRQPGITEELFTHILDSSSKTAKRNITARTPQLATIIAELEQVFQNEGEEEMT